MVAEHIAALLWAGIRCQAVDAEQQESDALREEIGALHHKLDGWWTGNQVGHTRQVDAAAAGPLQG